MRRSRKKKIRAVPTFAFVVDGETEVWYLQMLKRNERELRLNIKPEIPDKKSLKKQFELVMDLAEREYLKVFWIVDMDAIIKESRESFKGKRTQLQSFIEFRKKLEKKHKNVIVIVNNPCLEIWFLLHFEKNFKPVTCTKVEAELKKHIKDYEKSQKYFTKQDNDIYLKLRPFLTTAITHSENLGRFDENEPTKVVCEMYLLFQTEEFKEYFGK